MGLFVFVFDFEEDDDDQIECGTLAPAEADSAHSSAAQLGVGLGHKTEAAPPVQPCKPPASHLPHQHRHLHLLVPTLLSARPLPVASPSRVCSPLKGLGGGVVNLAAACLGLFAKPCQGCGAPLRPHLSHYQHHLIYHHLTPAECQHHCEVNM